MVTNPEFQWVYVAEDGIILLPQLVAPEDVDSLIAELTAAKDVAMEQREADAAVQRMQTAAFKQLCWR